MDDISLISHELEKRDIFHKVKNRKISTKKTSVKIPKFNKDISYLIGVISGDGSMTMSKRKKGGNHYVIRIYSEGDNYLKFLNRIIENQFGLEGSIKKDLRKENTYYLVIRNSVIFIYFLIKGNEPGKKKRFEVPEIIKKHREYFLDYIAGLTDTDGHISRQRIHLKQKSKNLLKEIKTLLDSESLNCTIPKVNYTNKKPYYYIRFSNKIPLRYKTDKFLK